MKKLLVSLAILLLSAGICVTTLRAQDVHLYLTEHELPNLVNCLPPPPDTVGEAFTHDIMRYMWGKAQRLDPERLAVAMRDAVWDLDTLCAIYSVPFGLKIDKETTPEIYRLFINGISTIEHTPQGPLFPDAALRPLPREFHLPAG